jgi:hypothetical protein
MPIWFDDALEEYYLKSRNRALDKWTLFGMAIYAATVEEDGAAAVVERIPGEYLEDFETHVLETRQGMVDGTVMFVHVPRPPTLAEMDRLIQEVAQKRPSRA